MSRHLHTFTALAVTLALIAPVSTVAQTAGSMTLLLVPHCTEAIGCPEFAVSDAEHIITNRLTAGDILDLDVLVRGQDYARVRSVKSWISYDPKILEARSVDITGIPSPTPGEKNIDTKNSLVKIGGDVPNGFTSADTRIARVTFRVRETTANTEIAFAGFNAEGTGTTAVNAARNQEYQHEGGLGDPPCLDTIIGCRGSTVPILSGEPSKLTVSLTDATVSSSTSSSSSANARYSSSSSSSLGYGTKNPNALLSGDGSTFAILQVQDLRVTTKDGVIFLGWQALRSAELAGYNIYYGTVSGRYIQRRSVPKNSTSLVLRDLEPGTTYYLAVRAVGSQDQESVFSQEVSVTVGQPETATSPMTNAPPESGAQTGNPIETRGGTTIEGETGLTNIFLWAIVTSAVIGTIVAFRRQLVLSAHAS